MKICLASLVLNEMQWLQHLYDQHRDWPDAVQWVFVESADRKYAEVNPDLVSKTGLSTDGTSDFLHWLSRRSEKVTYIPHGFSDSTDPAQGKCQARDRYIREADSYEPNFLYILDADEFYAKSDQQRINDLLGTLPGIYRSARFLQRDIWRPKSISRQPLFQHEVVGGYWKVRHCRFWRWEPGLSYQINHNWPNDRSGNLLNGQMCKFDLISKDNPQCIHMAFASDHKLRKAKHDYYVQRGEGRADGRQMYVDCRKAFETWEPGDNLPCNAKVLNYTGPIPEVFQQGVVVV